MYSSFRYHGNYVGPGWSAGKYQGSVAKSNVPAVDEFDETAKEHDRAYALNRNLKAADYKFYRKNIGKGVKRSVAALAVGIQGFLRRPTGKNSFLQKNKQIMPPVTPAKRRKTSPSSSVMRTPRTPRRVLNFGKLSSAKLRFRRGGVKRRKSKSQMGASYSKSSGFFKKGTSKRTPLDYFVKKGIVIARERGGQLTTNAIEKAQAFGIGHAVFGPDQLRYDAARAFCKAIAMKLGLIIEVFELDTVLADYTRQWECDVGYIRFPGDTQQVISYTITSTITWQQFADWIAGYVFGLVNYTNPQVLLQKLVLHEKPIATTPAVGGKVLLSLNLRGAKFDIYVKSALKIQNRTINSAGNDQADDVDNVPLYGKSYEGSGNWLQFNEMASIICPAYGDKTNTITSVHSGSTFYTEPGVKATLFHVNKVGKAHLDPGQLKTSLLVYRKKFTLNSLMKHFTRQNTSDASTTLASHISIGKYRIFNLEKMIQAVATTDVNGIQIAYETDHKCGIAMSIPKNTVTNYIVEHAPL